MTLLTSGSPDAIHGALQMFSEFGGDEISEDHLLPIQKELLPVLLAILSTPEVFELPFLVVPRAEIVCSATRLLHVPARYQYFANAYRHYIWYEKYISSRSRR